MPCLYKFHIYDMLYFIICVYVARRNCLFRWDLFWGENWFSDVVEAGHALSLCNQFMCTKNIFYSINFMRQNLENPEAPHSLRLSPLLQRMGISINPSSDIFKKISKNQKNFYKSSCNNRINRYILNNFRRIFYEKGSKKRKTDS